MHMRRKYVTHACMKAHISEHVCGEQPYMSKSKASKRRFCECGSESSQCFANGSKSYTLKIMLCASSCAFSSDTSWLTSDNANGIAVPMPRLVVTFPS